MRIGQAVTDITAATPWHCAVDRGLQDAADHAGTAGACAAAAIAAARALRSTRARPARALNPARPPSAATSRNAATP